jgi:LPS O-antigen subunit length determinant protein (WzzB/FepE family)
MKTQDKKRLKNDIILVAVGIIIGVLIGILNILVNYFLK